MEQPPIVSIGDVAASTDWFQLFISSLVLAECTPWTFNIQVDTKNGGVEKGTPLKYGDFWISMLNFTGENTAQTPNTLHWLFGGYAAVVSFGPLGCGLFLRPPGRIESWNLGEDKHTVEGKSPAPPGDV